MTQVLRIFADGPISVPKRAAFVLGIILQFGLSGCDSMTNLIIARKVSGIIVQNGTPAVGVKLERHWHWHLTEEKGEQLTTSGPDGRFTFHVVERRKPISAYFPHEPVIQQQFRANVNGQMVRIVICSRRRYTEDGDDRCAAVDNAPMQILFDGSGNDA